MGEMVGEGVYLLILPSEEIVVLRSGNLLVVVSVITCYVSHIIEVEFLLKRGNLVHHWHAYAVVGCIIYALLNGEGWW